MVNVPLLLIVVPNVSRRLPVPDQVAVVLALVNVRVPSRILSPLPLMVKPAPTDTTVVPLPVITLLPVQLKALLIVNVLEPVRVPLFSSKLVAVTERKSTRLNSS